MSHKNYFISDPHFGHRNIISFTDNKGNILRPFSSIEEHDDLIINNINKKVRVQDKLFILGDVAFKNSDLKILDKINTKKRVLIKGNHDLETLKNYCQYFKDIRSYKILPKHGVIFSHIPIHPCQLQGRFTHNIHGHMHGNKIDDDRYLNICPEQVGYKVLELEEILQRIGK